MAEALYQMYNLQLRLDIKHAMDGGTVDVAIGGTTVYFTKEFKDIDSITVTSKGTISYNAVYNFVDVPNPVSFIVYLFDSNGTPVVGTVSWKARGKI